MENQYTYYKPEPDDMNGMNEETPKPKKNRKVPKPVKLVCAGVAFGLVASVTFQAGNYVGTKVFGTTTTNGKTAKTAQTVEQHHQAVQELPILQRLQRMQCHLSYLLRI